MRSTLPTFNEIWQRQFRTGFLKQLQQFTAQQKFLIGCSGGIDSMLLLHLMAALCPERIRAIYINHQLQAPAAEWAEFVYAQANALNLDVIIQAVEVQAGNLEQAARNARYEAFQQHLQSNEVLVLAHHQQDQAETVLLRLFSGAGVHGLAGMQVLDVRENLCIWRPFLDLSRQHIAAWVSELKIAYIDDPTNTDTHYDRAWCRQELWPVLSTRFPQMQQAVVRSSVLMQDASEILQEVVQQDLAQCGHAELLNLTELASLSAARQRQLLSYWMQGQAQYRPSFDMVQRIQDEVIAAEADRQAALHCNGFYYVRYQTQLFRLPKAVYLAQQQQIPTQVCQFSLYEAVELPAGCFRAERTPAMGLRLDLLQQDLTISMRQGGEKIHLYGRVGSWPLKKAIQAAQIFPWRRHTIQILSLDNVMLGVFTPHGFWLADCAYCEQGGWLPHLVSEISLI